MTVPEDSNRVGLVRAMRAEDVASVAAIHRTCLPHGLFPRLGTWFMREYLRSFALSPHAIALVWDDSGQPQGFLVGTVGNRAHYRWVLRHRGWRLAALAALALLTRPALATMVVRRRMVPYAAALRRMAAGGGSPPSAEPVAEERPIAILTHVAVAVSHQGGGIGAELMDHFLGTATQRGAAGTRLSTMPGSAGASGFYLRRGWRHLTDARDWDGREITVLALDLPRRPQVWCGE